MLCDSAETLKDHGDHCNRCRNEWIEADDDLPQRRCKCGILHLERNLIEKIDGLFCEDCAAKIEQELLAKAIPVQ